MSATSAAHAKDLAKFACNKRSIIIVADFNSSGLEEGSNAREHILLEELELTFLNYGCKYTFGKAGTGHIDVM